MIVQYLYNGEIVATHNQIDGLPTFIKVPPRRTLKDLLAVELEPTRRPIRCVLDTYQPKELDFDKMMRTAFIRYKELSTVSNPKFIHWLDNVRWNIKKVLTKARIIL